MELGTIDCSSMVQFEHNYAAAEYSMMRSRVFFTLTIHGKSQSHLFVDIGQPYDTDYGQEPIEVSRPFKRAHNQLPEMELSSPYKLAPYGGSFNHSAFSDGVEKYYRMHIGKTGNTIQISDGCNEIRMCNNRIVSPYQFAIPLVEAPTANPW